jgi:hypothetical protein
VTSLFFVALRLCDQVSEHSPSPAVDASENPRTAYPRPGVRRWWSASVLGPEMKRPPIRIRPANVAKDYSLLAPIPYILTMSVELAVSLISAAVALGSAVLTALLGAQAAMGRLQLKPRLKSSEQPGPNRRDARI